MALGLRGCFVAAAISNDTNFGDNINNVGGASNYSFVLNNNGGNAEASGSIDHRDVIRAETMDMIMRLKRQGVI